jgi:peroxiredoxin
VRSDDLRAKGVDTIACVSVNDPFVMEAWRRSQGVGRTILMLADGTGAFAKEMGLEKDISGAGLGIRSQRYAAVIKDGIVTTLLVEPAGGLTVSSADSVLAAL